MTVAICRVAWNLHGQNKPGVTLVLASKEKKTKHSHLTGKEIKGPAFESVGENNYYMFIEGKTPETVTDADFREACKQLASKAGVSPKEIRIIAPQKAHKNKLGHRELELFFDKEELLGMVGRHNRGEKKLLFVPAKVIRKVI